MSSVPHGGIHPTPSTSHGEVYSTSSKPTHSHPPGSSSVTPSSYKSSATVTYGSYETIKTSSEDCTTSKTWTSIAKLSSATVQSYTTETSKALKPKTSSTVSVDAHVQTTYIKTAFTTYKTTMISEKIYTLTYTTSLSKGASSVYVSTYTQENSTPTAKKLSTSTATTTLYNTLTKTYTSSNVQKDSTPTAKTLSTSTGKVTQYNGVSGTYVSIYPHLNSTATVNATLLTTTAPIVKFTGDAQILGFSMVKIATAMGFVALLQLL
jgi:hypothetical protein